MHRITTNLKSIHVLLLKQVEFHRPNNHKLLHTKLPLWRVALLTEVQQI